jgi:hypothetical protein
VATIVSASSQTLFSGFSNIPKLYIAVAVAQQYYTIASHSAIAQIKSLLVASYIQSERSRTYVVLPLPLDRKLNRR